MNGENFRWKVLSSFYPKKIKLWKLIIGNGV